MSELLSFSIYNIFVCLVNIFGFISLACMIAFHLDQALIQTLPIATALWILLCYVLALGRWLGAVDAVSLLLIILCLCYAIRHFGREGISKIGRLLFAYENLSLFIVLLLAFILLKDLPINHADDTGCWALELKSILFFNGFAPEGKHASLLYGSYFPGTSLFRWWCYHLFPSCGEGMMAVGSAYLFILLISPFFSLSSRGPVSSLVSGIYAAGILLFIPGVVDSMSYQSICSELPMSAAFACALYALFFAPTAINTLLFYSCLFSLCFFKSAGIAYAVLLIIFSLIYKRTEPETPTPGFSPRNMLLSSAACVIPSLSWLLFCRLMSRSDYFSLSSPTASANSSVSAIGYIKSMASGFFTKPIHFVDDGVIALSAFSLVLILCILCLLAGRLGRINSRLSRALTAFIAISTVFLVFVICGMHIFVFRETPYLVPENMALSLGRYAMPLLLGSLLLLVYIYISGVCGFKKFASAALVAVLILCWTCPWTVYYRTINHADINKAAEEHTEYVRILFEDFIKESQAISDEGTPHRFFILCKEDTPFIYPEQARLQYVSVPNSIYFFYLPEQYNTAKIREELSALYSAYAPEYLYFYNLESADIHALFPESDYEVQSLYKLDDIL